MIFDDFLEIYQKKIVVQYNNAICERPLISISVVTYQHLNYIKECLDSMLMQETNFQFEILLGEDESTDGTREICIEYAEKYPDKIRLFLHHRENNIKINGNSTGRFNFLYNLYNARGKYIALCEGDDYWTDPLKLQKQIDFLEGNEEFGICFHNVAQLNTFDREKDSIIPGVKEDTVYSIEDYILSNRTATCSIVFRRELLGEIPSWFYKVPFGDLGLILLIMHNSNKKGIVLKDVMGVYRIHEGGIHGSFHESDNGLVSAYLQHIQFNKIISNQFFKEKKYKKSIFKKHSNTYNVLGRLYKRNNKLQFIKVTFLKSYYKLLIKII
jgi:glycosyltransferase involved in cell wall biosynthesis